MIFACFAVDIKEVLYWYYTNLYHCIWQHPTIGRVISPCFFCSTNIPRSLFRFSHLDLTSMQKAAGLKWNPTKTVPSSCATLVNQVFPQDIPWRFQQASCFPSPRRYEMPLKILLDSMRAMRFANFSDVIIVVGGAESRPWCRLSMSYQYISV